MWDLALIEEARELCLYFGTSRDLHVAGEQTTQIVLYKGPVVSVQTLLPGFLGPPTFLQRGGVWVMAIQVSGQTLPHSKRAWTVGEVAFVFEELEVHLTDVVLQVKGCREVGLAVVPGTNQHRLMGCMGPFVPPQTFRFLKHLLAHTACECGRVFGPVLLKFAPRVFKRLAFVMRTAVTCVLLLMGFAFSVRVKHCTTSVFLTLELSRNTMLFQVQS